MRMTFAKLVLATLPKKLRAEGGTLWNDALIQWWMSNEEAFSSCVDAFSDQSMDDLNGLMRDGGIEIALCAMPSLLAIRRFLPRNDKRKIFIEESADRLDLLLSDMRIPSAIVSGALKNQRIRSWAQCGDLPVSLMATSMGRGWILAENPISISTAEARNCIAQCIEADDRICAMKIFENAAIATKKELGAMVWRGVDLNLNTSPLPSTDPPAAWWDFALAQNNHNSLPEITRVLVESRPHLAKDLAGAMLRSGKKYLETLSHANPGLKSTGKWVSRDNLQMSALGVALDSWSYHLKGQTPSEEQITELRSKLAVICGAVQGYFSDDQEHISWGVVGQSIGRVRCTKTGLSLHRHEETDPPVDVKTLVSAIEFLNEHVYRNATKHSLTRWARTSVLAIHGACLEMDSYEEMTDHGTLSLARSIFITQFVSGSADEKLDAARAISTLLNDHQKFLGRSLGSGKHRMEKELWRLFVSRCESTAGWERPKDISWDEVKICRKIQDLSEEHAWPCWSSKLARLMEETLGNDELLPPWAISIFQKEALRDRGEHRGETGTARSRL